MIRCATIADKARVIELLRDAAPVAFGDLIPFDPAYADRLFRMHLASGQAIGIVHAVDDVPQGVLLATCGEHTFGPVYVARETVWWIDPAYRGGTAAVRMLDAFERWAFDEMGCGFAGLAGMASDPRVATLYERRGYRHVESHFLLGRAT